MEVDRACHRRVFAEDKLVQFWVVHLELINIRLVDLGAWKFEISGGADQALQRNAIGVKFIRMDRHVLVQSDAGAVRISLFVALRDAKICINPGHHHDPLIWSFADITKNIPLKLLQVQMDMHAILFVVGAIQRAHAFGEIDLASNHIADLLLLFFFKGCLVHNLGYIRSVLAIVK